MNPRLLLLRSLWTNGLNCAAALADCAAGRFDGVEGPVPSGTAARRDFAHFLRVLHYRRPGHLYTVSYRKKRARHR